MRRRRRRRRKRCNQALSTQNSSLQTASPHHEPALGLTFLVFLPFTLGVMPQVEIESKTCTLFITF